MFCSLALAGIHNFHLSCKTSQVSLSQHSARKTGGIRSTPAASRSLKSCTFSPNMIYTSTVATFRMRTYLTQGRVCNVIVRADAHNVQTKPLFCYLCPLLVNQLCMIH